MKKTLVLFLLSASILLGQTQIEFRPVESIRIQQDENRIVIQTPPIAHLKKAFLKVESLEDPKAVRMGRLPKATEQDELGDDIYRQELILPLIFDTSASELELTVTYQPCTEGPGGICYPPTQQKIKVRPVTSSSSVTDMSFSWWSFVGIFFAGLLAAFTPCVYPTIPITLAVIGIRDITRTQAALLTFALIIGMALTYSTLGVIAALTGNVFGSILGSVAFITTISGLFIIFGISLLGFFEISLSSEAQTRLQSWTSRSGVWGPFLTGVALGPISAPCVGPILGTILVAISQGKTILLGAIELFIFALGMGVPFMMVGVLGTRLPKSGVWLEFMKKTMGFMVIAFALWTLRTVLPITAILWMCLILTIISFLIYLKMNIETAYLNLVRKVIFIFITLFVLYFTLRLVEVNLNVTIFRGSIAKILGLDQSFKKEWRNQDLETAILEAKKQNRPILVDIYSDWCAACYELDEKTWPDEDLRAYIQSNYIAIRIDTDKIRPDLAKRYQIIGYPTVLILDADGQEIRRSLGYRSPKDMLKFIKLNQSK